MSCVVTMFGWRSRAATCASRRKRCFTSSSCDGSTKASSRIRLTATSRPEHAVVRPVDLAEGARAQPRDEPVALAEQARERLVARRRGRVGRGSWSSVSSSGSGSRSGRCARPRTPRRRARSRGYDAAIAMRARPTSRQRVATRAAPARSCGPAGGRRVLQRRSRSPRGRVRRLRARRPPARRRPGRARRTRAPLVRGARASASARRTREPAFDALRPKLARAAFVPSWVVRRPRRLAAPGRRLAGGRVRGRSRRGGLPDRRAGRGPRARRGGPVPRPLAPRTAGQRPLRVGRARGAGGGGAASRRARGRTRRLFWGAEAADEPQARAAIAAAFPRASA